MLSLLLATAFAEAIREDGSVPYKSEATDLESLWEEARSFLERTGSPPPEKLEQLMGARTHQLLTSFIESSRAAGAAQSVRLRKWKAPTAASIDPSLTDPSRSADFERRVAARMGKAEVKSDPLQEMKARLQKDLAKTDATFQHDARLDVPSYFDQLKRRGEAVLTNWPTVLAAHASLAETRKPLPDDLTSAGVHKWVTDTAARNKQVEEDMSKADWSLPSADDMQGVIQDEPVSKSEEELIAGEPEFEKENAAEVAHEAEEKEREAKDYKALEVLVEHPPRPIAHLQTHEDAHGAGPQHAQHNPQHDAHPAHNYAHNFRKD